MEKWDLYDKAENKTGKIINKGLGHIPEGYFHIIVETLVKHVDGTYLVTQRSFNKKEAPGAYESSAGGSILAGETKEEGARREVFEEVGLVVTNLSPTYYFIYPERGVINQGYLTLIDGPKDNVKIDGVETISYKWLTLSELKKFIHTPEYNKSHQERLETYLNTINE